MKKRILSLLFTLCLVVGMMPTSVLPASAAVNDCFTRGDFTYKVLGEGNNNTVAVKGSSNLSGEVIIPKTVENGGTTYTVTSIGGRAFSNCTALTSVTIPSSVTSIGDNAFANCNSLATVTFGEGSRFSFIGYCAFSDCTALTSITIPSSVTSIGNGAFENCDSLATVTFDEGSRLSLIGGRAFSGCTALTSITIPSSVTEVGYSAFYNCAALTSVTIPSSVTSISNNAFNSCPALTSVTIPSSVTEVGCNAFCNCDALTSVTIPSSVTEVGDWAFSLCDALTSVTIPSSVTEVGNGAFSYCDALTSITLPCDFNTDLNNTGIYIDSSDSSKFGVTSDNTTTGTITITHTYFAQHSGTEWKSDKDNHWHECSCGDIADTTAHTPKVVNAKEATATEKGYTGDTVCEICGYEIAKGGEIPVKATPAGTNEGESADDNSNIFLWMAMLFVSGLGIVSATVLVKKRKADR